ncbi:MAG: SLC45 family MFS transporter [Chloroflexi bacterium]|nr:SLC45 family MFS transporter [Chloroflexota bacterium]
MKLNYGKTFLLGFGFFGVSVIWAVYNAFVPIFLEKKFGLPPEWIGFFMTLDNIAALLIQPPVGAWSDNLRSRIGRRMPFILIGAPIAAVAFGVIPLANVLPLFVAGTGTLMLSMAMWRTPVVALMPDITPSHYRSQANGIINFMGGIGAIIAFLVGANLYDRNPAFPFWMGSVLVIIAAVMVFIFIKEPHTYEEKEKEPSMLTSLREVIADPDKSGLRILLAIFFWFLGYAAIEAFFSLYAVKHLGLKDSDGARLLTGLSLVFVIFALPSGYIGAKIGRRTTIIGGIVVMSAVMVTMFFLPPAALISPLAKLPVVGIQLNPDSKDTYLVVIGVLLMVAGMGWALININSLPMVVDMTVPARIGTFTGLYYLFSTFSAIVGPNVNGWIISLTGRNYNAVMIVAPIFMALALVMMIGVKRGEAVMPPAAVAAD